MVNYKSVEDVNLVEISELTKDVTTLSIIKSNEPILGYIDKKGGKKEYGIAGMYINYKYAKLLFGEANTEICAMFMNDLFESEPYWKFTDVVNFWKFIKNNGLKPFGKITLAQLHEWRMLYNEDIAKAREIHHKQLKQETTENLKGLQSIGNLPSNFKAPHKIAVEMGKLMDTAAKNNEANYKPLTDEERFEAHTNFFKK